MSPLTPLTIRVAVPAATGAGRPVWTRAGMVMNASVAEANTHGASGMAQLNADRLARRDGVGSAAARGGAGAVPIRRRAAPNAKAVATKTRAAAIPKDTRMPDRP